MKFPLILHTVFCFSKLLKCQVKRNSVGKITQKTRFWEFACFSSYGLFFLSKQKYRGEAAEGVFRSYKIWKILTPQNRQLRMCKSCCATHAMRFWVLFIPGLFSFGGPFLSLWELSLRWKTLRLGWILLFKECYISCFHSVVSFSPNKAGSFAPSKDRFYRKWICRRFAENGDQCFFDTLGINIVQRSCYDMLHSTMVSNYGWKAYQIPWKQLILESQHALATFVHIVTFSKAVVDFRSAFKVVSTSQRLLTSS